MITNNHNKTYDLALLKSLIFYYINHEHFILYHFLPSDTCEYL